MAERKLIIQPITYNSETDRYSTDLSAVRNFFYQPFLDSRDMNMSVLADLLADKFILTFMERYVDKKWHKNAEEIEEKLAQNQCNPDDLLYALKFRNMKFSDLWYVATAVKDFVDELMFSFSAQEKDLRPAEELIQEYHDKVTSVVRNHQRDEDVSFTMTITMTSRVKDGKPKTIYSQCNKAFVALISEGLSQVSKSDIPFFLIDINRRPLDQTNKNYIFQTLLENYIEGFPYDKTEHRNFEFNKGRKVKVDETSIMSRMAYLVGFVDEVACYKDGAEAWDKSKKINAKQKKNPECMANLVYPLHDSWLVQMMKK